MARLLVIDDVKFIAAMVASTREKAGHEVTVATDGTEAIRLPKETLPDLILRAPRTKKGPGSATA